MSDDLHSLGEGGIEIPPHLQEWTEGQRLIDAGGQLGLVDRADYRADQYENYPDIQLYVSSENHSIWAMPGNSSNDDPDLFELFQLQDRELGTEWTDGSLRLAPVNDSTGGQERDATALELAEHTGQPGTRFFIGHDGVTLYAVYPSGTVEHLSHARIIPNAEAVEVDPVASPVAHGEETVRGQAGQLVNGDDGDDIEFSGAELPADAEQWTDETLQIQMDGEDGSGFEIAYTPAQLRVGIALPADAPLYVSKNTGTIYALANDELRELHDCRCTDVSPLTGAAAQEPEEEPPEQEVERETEEPPELQQAATPESTADETRVSALSLLASADYWGDGDRELIFNGDSVTLSPVALRALLGFGENVELYIGNDGLVRGYIEVGNSREGQPSSRVEQELGAEVRVVESDDPIIEMVPEDWELWNEGSRSIIIATGDGNVQMSFTSDELCHHFNIELGTPLYIQPNGAIGRLDDTGNTVTILDATDADSVRTPEEEPPEQVAIEIPNDWTPWSIGERRVRIGRNNIHTLTPQQLVENHIRHLNPGTPLYINENSEICVINSKGFEEVYGDAVVLPEEFEIPSDWQEWERGDRMFWLTDGDRTNEISTNPYDFVRSENVVPDDGRIYINGNGNICCVVENAERIYTEYELMPDPDGVEPPFEEPPENINLPVGWVEWPDGTDEIIAVTEGGATNNEMLTPAGLIARENLPAGTTIYILPTGQIGFENPVPDPSVGGDDSHLSFGPKYLRLDPNDPNAIIAPSTWTEWTADERYFTHATAGQMRLDPAGLIAREPMLPAGARLFVDDSGNLCYIHGSHQQPNTGYQQLDVPPNLTQWTNGDTRMLLDSSSGQDFLNVDPAGLMADGRYAIPQGSMLFIDDSNQVCYIDASGTQQTLPNCRVIDSADPLHIVGTNNWTVWDGTERRFEHTHGGTTEEVMLNEAALRARETALSADAVFYLDSSGNLCYVLHGNPEPNTGYRVLDVPSDFAEWTTEPVWYTTNDGVRVLQQPFAAGDISAREAANLPAGARLYRDASNQIRYMDGGPQTLSNYHALDIPANFTHWDSGHRRVQRAGGTEELLSPADIIAREPSILDGSALFVDDADNVWFFDDSGRRRSASYVDITSSPVVVSADWRPWNVGDLELAFDDGSGAPVQLTLSPDAMRGRLGVAAGTEFYINAANEICAVENNATRTIPEYTLSPTVAPQWMAWAAGDDLEFEFDDGTGPQQLTLNPDGFIGRHADIAPGTDLYMDDHGVIWCLHNGRRHQFPDYVMNPTVPADWTLWNPGDALELAHTDPAGVITNVNMTPDVFIANLGLAPATDLYINPARHVCCLQHNRRQEFTNYEQRITAPAPVVPPPAPVPAPLAFAAPLTWDDFYHDDVATFRNDRTGATARMEGQDILDECGFPAGTELFIDTSDGTLYRVLPGEDTEQEVPNYRVERYIPAPPPPARPADMPGGPRTTPDPVSRTQDIVSGSWLWNTGPVRALNNGYNWLGSKISNVTQGRFWSTGIKSAEAVGTGAAISLPATTRLAGWAGFDGIRATLNYSSTGLGYYAYSMLGPLVGPLSVLAPSAFSGANRGKETGREYRAVLDLTVNPEDSIANQDAQLAEMNRIFRTDLGQKQDELIDTKDEVALMQALQASKLAYPPDVPRMSTVLGGDKYYAEYTLARMTALADMCASARRQNPDAIDTPDFATALEIIGRGMDIDLTRPANDLQRRAVEQELREGFNRLTKEQKLIFASHNIVNPQDGDVDDSLLKPAPRDSADLQSRTRVPRVLPEGVSATCSKTDASVTLVLSGVPSVTLYPTIGPDGNDRPVANALIRAAADKMIRERSNARNVHQLNQDTNIDTRKFNPPISVNIDQTDATVDVVYAGQPPVKLMPTIAVGGADVAVTEAQVDEVVAYLTSVYAPTTPGIPSTDVARLHAETSVPPYVTSSDVNADVSTDDASVTLTLGTLPPVVLYPRSVLSPDRSTVTGFRAVSEYEIYEAAAALENRLRNSIDYAEIAAATHIPPGYDPPCTFTIDTDDASVRIELDKVQSVELHPDWEHERPVSMEQIREAADGMIQRKYGALHRDYPPALRRQQLIQSSIAYGRMINNNHRERAEGRVRGAIVGPMVLSGALGMFNPVMGLVATATYAGRYGYRRWRNGKSNLELNPDNPEGELQGRDGATIINPEIQKKLKGAHIAHEGTINNYKDKNVDAIESNKPAKYWYDKINFAAAKPGYEKRRYKDAMHLARHVAQEVQTGLADEVPPPVDYDSSIDKKEKSIGSYENKIIAALKTMQPGRNGAAEPSAIRIAEGQIKKHEAEIRKLEEEKAELEKKKDEAGKPIGLEKAGNDPAIRVAFAVHVQQEFSVLAEKQHWSSRVASGAAGIATSEGAIKAGKAVAAPLAVGGLSGAGVYGAAVLGGATGLALPAGLVVGTWVAGKFIANKLTSA